MVLDHFCVGDYCFGFSSEPVPGTEGKGKGRNKNPKTRYIKEWDEIAWVIKIFYWFVVERRSLRWIARELNRLGAPEGSSRDNAALASPTRGGPFEQSEVYRLVALGRK